MIPFLVAVAVAGGCGTLPGSPPTSRATAVPGAGKAGGLTLCRTVVLAVSVNTAQAGTAQGSTYLPLNFTNTSGTSCEMNGFPGVSLMTGPRGKQVGATAARDKSFDASRVILEPGHSAHAWLQVARARNYPARGCDPVVAGWLRVYPPGQTAATYIPHQTSACRSAADAIVTVLPVRPGIAARGTVP
jgi:Protein of unknown function (DUF4232)